MSGNEFEILSAGTRATAVSEQIAELEQALSAEKDKKKEERFLWIVAAVVAIDYHMFKSMETWAGPISILILELIVLLPLAKRLGVEMVQQLINKALDSFGNGRAQ